MHLPRWSAALVAFAVLPAFTQTPDRPSTPEKTEVEKLREEFNRKIEILSKQLEAQQTGGSIAPEAGETGVFGLGPAASKVYSAKGGLSIGGYGEFLYSSTSARDESGNRNYQNPTLDQLRGVFYLGYKFSDKIVFNSEIEFEHGGYGDERNQGEAHTEFAYLDFLLSKGINIRVGHFLVPMGFINEFHEPPIFLGANRPYVESDDEGLIPTTWHENGAGILGDLPGNLSYRLFVMNGLTANAIGGNVPGFGATGIHGGRQDGSFTNAQSLAVTGRLDWTPMPGTLFGTSFWRGNSNQTGDGPALTTTVVDGHAEYRARGLQLRALYVHTTNSEAGVAALGVANPAFQVGTKMFGGYFEAGYDVLTTTGSRKSLIPFVRFERKNSQAAVVEGATPDPANDKTIRTVGLVFKPMVQIAVKANYDVIQNHAHTGQNRFNLAVGYLF